MNQRVESTNLIDEGILDACVGPSGTTPNAFSFCESVVQYDEHIVISSLLQGNESIGWFVRPGTPIPNEEATRTKVVQTQLVASIVKQNESYLGKVRYIHVQQDMADVILLPRDSRIILCVVITRPYDFEKLVTKISDSLDFLVRS